MEEIEPATGTQDSEKRLRRILVIAGITLAILIVVGAAIYAGVFLILAPMMQ